MDVLNHVLHRDSVISGFGHSDFLDLPNGNIEPMTLPRHVCSRGTWFDTSNLPSDRAHEDKKSAVSATHIEEATPILGTSGYPGGRRNRVPPNRRGTAFPVPPAPELDGASHGGTTGNEAVTTDL